MGGEISRGKLHENTASNEKSRWAFVHRVSLQHPFRPIASPCLSSSCSVSTVFPCPLFAPTFIIFLCVRMCQCRSSSSSWRASSLLFLSLLPAPHLSVSLSIRRVSGQLRLDGNAGVYIRKNDVLR